MTVEERLREVIRGYVGDCTCHEAYTGRQLQDPNCIHCYIGPEELAEDLAGVVREAQAQALRDAADELVWVRPEVSPCGDTEGCCGSVESCDAMRPSVRVVGEGWLRARADRIEKGEP